jgi:hypothetical protein
VAQETSTLTSLWPFSLAGGGGWYKNVFLVKVGCGGGGGGGGRENL